MSNQRADKTDDFAEVCWSGPFSWGDDGPEPGRLDPYASAGELERLRRKRGLYMILGDHPTHGARALLYIGQTKQLSNRLLQHSRWIASEWRVEVYLAEVKPQRQALVAKVEKLLIYAHSPAYNSSSISSFRVKRSLRVWNHGRFFRLHPEVSSTHEWYAK